MEQRRLRLGDILDDYCPRERRVTNHAIVAMVEDDIKQTRCTTCDAEHVYKGGQAPRRKKLETTGKLYKQVLAGLSDQPVAAGAAEPDMMDEPDAQPEPIEVIADVVDTAPSHREHEPDETAEPSIPLIDEEPQPSFDDGPVHRPLIRAQLPRIDGVKAERQAPDFTIRQNAGRGRGSFGGPGNGNGQRFGRGPQRGSGRGGYQSFGRGAGGTQQRSGGPRKRGR
jgi:hypothetical protein